MVSPTDRAKRALVTLICSLAVLHNSVIDISRGSQDDAVKKTYRQASRWVHPDRGGSEEDQKGFKWSLRGLGELPPRAAASRPTEGGRW